MSAHQMLCHLNDSFRGVIGERPISPASSAFTRTVLKCVALYAPMAWPRSIPTRPEVDAEIGGTKPSEFARDLGELEALIARFVRSEDVAPYTHPAFGHMSRQQWMRWAWLHVDHHLRQFGL